MPKPLGYRFDPSPVFLTDLIASGDLLPIDKAIVDLLVRYRYGLMTSCWTTKQKLAELLNCSVRTVQRSFVRLVAAGVIAHRRVAVPDPEASSNRTGWRIDFLWLVPPVHLSNAGPKSQGKANGGPETQPLGTKEIHEIFVSPGGGDTKDASGETQVSPKYASGSNCNSDSIKPDSSSSSPSVKTALSVEKFPELGTDDDEIGLRLGENTGSGSVQDLIDTAKAYFPNTPLASQIEENTARIGKKLNHDWLAAMAALAMAKKRRERPADLISYMFVVAKDFVDNGISGEAKRAMEKLKPKPAPTPSAKPPVPPRDLDAEIAEAEKAIADPATDANMKRLGRATLAEARALKSAQADGSHA